MKHDIETREDIIRFVNEFYNRVQGDNVIGYIFTEIAKVDWDKHLPKMYDFWETVLFGKAVFKGNPMEVHIRLNREHPLEQAHFNRWKEIFKATIDDLFAGNLAEETKKKAESIAGLMEFKINNVGKIGTPVKIKNNLQN